MLVEDGWNVFIYVYEGSVMLDRTVSKGMLAVFDQSGDLKFQSGKENTQFIVVAGEPLDEPVARGGPFVMNTREEVMQAFEDYQNGEL